MLILEDLIAVAFIFVLFSLLFSFREQLLVDLFLSEHSFVFYGLPATGFPRAQARRGRAGKAISRKWRARYTGRRAVQFRISNWYPRAAESPTLWSDESAVCRWENVSRMFRASSSLQKSLNGATSDSSR